MHDQTSYSLVLKNRGFLNLWSNQILVQFAYNCLNFALILWVFFLTQSNTAVASLLLAVYSPALLFGAFAGVVADMVDRKKVIIIINLAFTLVFISLIFLKGNFLAILGMTFLINSLAQFYVAAESSSLPLIVKREQLFSANSLFSTTYFSMFLIGFGLSGPIINLFDIDFIFKLGAGALFIAFLMAFKFPSITTKSDLQSVKLKEALLKNDLSKAFWASFFEVKKTLRFIKGNLPVLSAIFIMAGMQGVVGSVATLLPSFLDKILQIRTTDVSYIVVLPLGIGMVLGAIILGKLGSRWTRRILVGRAVLIAGLMLFLVGVAPLLLPAIQHFPKPKAVSFLAQLPLSSIMALGSLLLGMMVVSVIIPSQTVLQENTKKEDRGKVFGVLLALIAGLSLPPIIFAGILSDIFGSQPIFIALGGFIAITGLFIIKPDFFFHKNQLTFKVREFLGLGHWEK